MFDKIKKMINGYTSFEWRIPFNVLLIKNNGEEAEYAATMLGMKGPDKEGKDIITIELEKGIANRLKPTFKGQAKEYKCIQIDIPNPKNYEPKKEVKKTTEQKQQGNIRVAQKITEVK